MNTPRTLWSWALGAALLLSVSGCKDQVPEAASTEASKAKSLHCIAGSELKDLEPLLRQAEQATGIAVRLTYSGTLEGIERIGAGESFDCAWFSHAKYLMLAGDTKDKIKASERILLSPVVLGVNTSKARQLGWQDKPVAWKDIIAAVDAGKLSYGMTSPATSNSGLTTLVGAASALAGTQDALQAKDIQAAALKRFAKGQKLTAGSSGWLAEAFVRDQKQIDALFNYESVLLSLNQSGQLKEPLTLIYPSDGLLTADYPLVLLQEARRTHYEQLVAYLKEAAWQQQAAGATLRRPIHTDARAAVTTLPAVQWLELPFPRNVEVVDSLLSAWLNEWRRPATSYFVLDTSGSMDGERLHQLKVSLRGLSGDDQSLSGRFARLQDRERFVMIEFNGVVKETHHFSLEQPEQRDATRAQIRQTVNQLNAFGGTAIYSALDRALQLISQEMAQDATAPEKERLYSVVLMTDGANNQGLTAPEFIRNHSALAPAVQRVRVFPVLFGEAVPQELTAIAEISGGRVFDGRKIGLQQVFKEIRGYQ
jgi:Ca-activated chloride channel homolog